MQIKEGKLEGFYYKYQKKDGVNRTMFLLHGLTGNSSIWNEHIDIMSKNDLNFLNIDLIGHGNSDTPDKLEGYSFKDQTEKIIKILKLLEINDLIIVPYSYSTYLGSLIYEKVKDKTHSMIFIGPYFKEKRGTKEKIISSFINFVWKYLIPDKKHYLDYSKLKNYEEPNFHDNRYTLKSINTKDYLGSVYSLINFEENHNLGIKDIEVPVLIIYGEGDKMVSQKQKADFEKLKNVKISIIENKKHLFLNTNAKKIVKEIEDFLYTL